MSTVYATRDEAIDQEIIEPITAGDVDSATDEFDIEGIAETVLVWEDAYDADRDAHLLHKQGYRLADTYQDPDAFWDVVTAHAR